MLLKVINFFRKENKNSETVLKKAKCSYDGGCSSLPKDRQLQVGLKIFNDALKGKKK